MKKFMKTTFALLLGGLFAFATACGNSGTASTSSTGGTPSSDNSTSGTGSAGGTSDKESSGGGNQGGVSATIKFYTSVNIIEYKALTAVANAYSDLQYDKGNDITIIIDNKTDPEAYTQSVRNMVSQGVSGRRSSERRLFPNTTERTESWTLRVISKKRIRISRATRRGWTGWKRTRTGRK